MSATDRRTPSPSSAKPSAPIPIATSHHRARSGSGSSTSSDGSPPPQTPIGAYGTLPRVATGGAGASPTSPIMTLLGSGQALKSPTAYPFTRAPFSAVDDDDLPEPPVARHARRTSMSGGTARFALGAGALAGAQSDRGAGVLRRLSLGGTFGRAQLAAAAAASAPPAPVAPARISRGPEVVAPPAPRGRRGTVAACDPSTVANDAAGSPTRSPTRRTRRAPSPHGERMLKGHFDSFH